MPKIKLLTEINADIEIVFDLSRSIDLHKISTANTNETAIAGKTTGLLGIDEYVTWRAKHFGVYQKLTTKITAFERPIFFVDEMVNGAFKSFRHEHHFEAMNHRRTLITDYFYYKSPLGVLGHIADGLFLKKYMTLLLEKRNRTIKDFAESEQWKLIYKPPEQ